MKNSLEEVLHSEQEEKSFTYHKKSGYTGFIWVIVFVMVVESVGVSFLLYKWSAILHWAHLILSISVILFLLVDLQAVTKNPLLIKNNQLSLKIGIRPKVVLNINDIKEFRNGNLYYDEDKKKKEVLDLSLIGLDQPTFELVLETPIHTKPLIGRSNSVSRIFFSVDDKEEFLNLIRKSK
ncbi:hypothetical protein [Neobacillus vireti]|uniref:hypothetical protein n=1 Tax=Neobacillus vireti TaxID=220686 RepID=UPI002FFEB672